jgi:1,3-beta-glucan synthase
MFLPSSRPVAFLTLFSRQIRPPIYSLKQTKLRKRRVIRYAILYFVLLIVFLVLIVGPIVAGTKFKFALPALPMDILQPTGYNNNDTSTSVTGQCIQANCPIWGDNQAAATGGGGGGGAADSTAAARFRRYMAY